MAPLRTLLQWLIWVAGFSLATVAVTTADAGAYSTEMFRFTESHYNASIPENSLGKTFLRPASKMGIYFPENYPLKVSYQIVDNSDELFRVEDFVVGDFCFLLVRTHTNSYGRLNRELRSEYQLRIEATGSDVAGNTYKNYTDLTIYISDLNDLQPLFDHKFYNISVREDTQLHTNIAQVSAFDGDEGVNAEIYYSFSEPTNVLAIHPTSGIVTLTKQLQYSVKNTYTFDILAEDRGPKLAQNSKKRPVMLSVSVVKVNYFAPEISVKTLPSVTIEQSQVETVVAIVTVEDKDTGNEGRIDTVELDGLQISPSFISVNRGNKEGEYLVNLIQTPDTSLPSSGFNVTLVATDLGTPPLSSNTTFYVGVLDVQAWPKFTKGFFNASVEEVVPINTPVCYLSVVESTNQFELHFEIVEGNRNNMFRVNQKTGLIYTAAILDAEKVSQLELKVVVYDRLQTGQRNMDTTIVQIVVTDCNDNAPVFSIPDNISEIYIQENLPIGASVFQISATDADSNENGRVSFSIANVKNVPFDIDPFTGVIKVKEILDFETMRQIYKLKIRVSDWGTPFSREAEMIFSINLQDVNDNEPHFEKRDCSGHLARDAPIGTEILVVPAVDLDISDILTYKIRHGNEDGCFTFEQMTATLHLNCSLKNAQQQTRRLQIIADDGKYVSDPIDIEITLVNSKLNNQLANSDVHIQCQTSDISQALERILAMSNRNNGQTDYGIVRKPVKHTLNGFPPLFNASTPKILEVLESSPVGSVLARMQAYDEDQGYEGMLVYVIRQGDPDGHFKVDTHTGGLIVKRPLDREVKDLYEIIIEVSDLGSPKLSANTTLAVRVLDDNDNPPVFEQDEYTASIFENIFVNATVTQVHASDRDSSENGDIVYGIISDTQHFSINPTNGIISVNKALDRERHQVYNVLVRASDRGKISLSSTATVKVDVQDVNDNVPQFVPEVTSIRIREDLPVGAVITVVTAADLDSGDFGKVTYELVYGTDFFDIDEDTGVIRLGRQLDFEKQQIHNISVRAQDGGSPPLMSSCFINVEVVDVNENLQPPVFDNFFAHGYVNENEPISTIVMFVTAHDPDGEEDRVTYSIRDGSGLGRFTIDNNGTIKTNQVLDRETTTHYWLTVYAQDHGLVPLHTRLDVYIEVKDVNDNIPMTFEPVYYASVPENDAETGKFLVQVQAYDLDENPAQQLTYEITRWDTDNFFDIDRHTGVVTTTGKRLDREDQDQHILEVTVSDNGEPNLTYRGRVVIKVEDENDCKPIFSERLYRVRIPEATHSGGADIPVFQVIASDEDEGENGEMEFSIRGGERDATSFRIHPKTGIIYSTQGLVSGDIYQLSVKAIDHGRDQIRKSTTRVRIEIVKRLKTSPSSPRFVSPEIRVSVLEDIKVASMVELVYAVDPDGDALWYSIIDGDPDRHLSIGMEAGNILVAQKLDYEYKSLYNLTVQVTDGVYMDYCSVIVTVIDTNDNHPAFTQTSYHGDVSESAEVGTTIVTVLATDADSSTDILYTLPVCCNSQTSQELFNVDPVTGDVMVNSPLDREVAVQHNLTIMVRDQVPGSHKNFCRVHINVLDHNDHRPQFLSEVFHGRVFETAAIGTSVVQVIAMDQDKGQNAELMYTILSGNIGGMFSMDWRLGTVSVAKELDRDTKSQYNLIIMATDKGRPPLSSTATVEIHVTISDNAPPKFSQTEYTAEIHENEPGFTNVFTLNADCRSSLVYHILSGNEKGKFALNPNSGVVYSNGGLDYETDRFFNLTVSATSIIHATAVTSLLIHIVDENDNAPEFKHEVYFGNVTETAKPGTVVLGPGQTPLVVEATDKDANLNGLLVYEIRDLHAKDYVTIDANTGAIQTVAEFDHEKFSQLEFSVEVWDLGQPKLRAKSPAQVVIYVNDVNDTPPKFSQPVYKADVLLPTYKDVVVIKLNASDDDDGINSELKFSIVNGNEAEKFSINPLNGEIFVVNETGMADSFLFTVKVSDGMFDSTADVNIAVKKTSDSTIKFSKDKYRVSVQENWAQVDTLTVVQILDRALNEQFTFSLLNGQDRFFIGRTSGVLRTSGRTFDREEISMYNLVVEVRRETRVGQQRAHTVVEVTIIDENDCTPMFVNQPYHAVIVFDSILGETVKQVTALDKDAGVNGEVVYSLQVQGRSDMDNKFQIDFESGRITLSSPLSESDVGKEMMLTVEAADKGTPRRTTQSMVKITIISKSYPVFEQQVYKANLHENSPNGASVISLTASSPKGQKMVYTITSGDRYGDFGVDFNIDMDVMSPCVITVQGQVDFEMTTRYNLTVQATETMSGLSATTMVIITVQDVNDKKPSFDSLSYVATISEAVSAGTSVTIVTARDEDSEVNGLVHYVIGPAVQGSQDLDYFLIDSQTGIITTRLFLDHEKQSEFKILVYGIDGGVPSLSSSAMVRVLVTDLNNNAPVFDQSSYHCTITDQVKRGQLVTKVSATDPDTSSAGLLRYSIIGGNDRQIFHMKEDNGIISLSEQRKPNLHSLHELNVSVSDGVFTNFARVTIMVRNSNNFAPTFRRSFYAAEVMENAVEGTKVTQVIAEDKDPGVYGMLTFTIVSDQMKQFFFIDADSGEIYTEKVLDREMYNSFNIPVAASDNGGRMTFASVHVTVTDENDNIPQFLATEYKATILADAPVNQTVLKVRATDEDAGPNGKLQYSIRSALHSRVTQLFNIDPQSGQMSLRISLADSVNEAFQFFVSVTDLGSPKLENNIPVYIWVTDPSSPQPVFQHQSYSFFMLETDPVDTVIATVAAHSSSDLIHTLVQGSTKGSNSPKKFSIDKKGRIRVAGLLDREETSAYTLTVMAETLTKPPLVALAEVTVRLMDVNDNTPYFESDPYMVTVAEHTDVGTDLIQVVAHDMDRSSRFTYTFSRESHKYLHFFGLDSDTGAITLLSPLDREEQDAYNLTVEVRDSEDGDALFNTTVVNIRVMDHNDNPPQFSRQHYQAAVNEDAFQGTILLEITTKDKDLGINTEVRYYIIDGDALGKFQVSKFGEIFVNRKLDRETVPRYKLVIAATDGAFVSTTDVTVDILDDNDNSPTCNQPMLVTVVSEAARPTDIIARVKATDQDEYGSIHYVLNGTNADHFTLGKRSGVLTVSTSLDREAISSYTLLASAVDNGDKSCTTELFLTITDVNDNAPRFPADTITVTLSEDAQLNTLVYRAHAHDADIGINKQINYKLLENGEGTFRIDRTSGLIQLNKQLDRETTALYKLTIRAEDQGTPQLMSEMVLDIVILDVNDNPPEFEQTTYFATVRESADVGAMVTHIQATSRDTGVNARISYYIEGGNDQNKFVVNETTGVISTVGLLDHETLPGYILTVGARDHGDVPLSNTAYVQINVTDINDNPPVFAQTVYSTRIREDVRLGTKLLQVITSDPDSDPINKAINFTIEGGDHFEKFKIDLSDGTITVNSPLDRETVDSYVLHVKATNYHLTADAMVNVDILDANDCPPRFSQDNYTVYVQEDKEIASSILHFYVTDDDLDPNGEPFVFDIVQGDDKRKFRIDKEQNLRIASDLNPQVTATYNLVVRVFDNGTPSMYSDVNVKVIVIEESTYPPVVTDLDVSICSYKDEFPGGVIGQVKANDEDKYDTVSYKVESHNRHLFDIDKKDGRIIAFAGLDSGMYALNISVTDGKYTSYGKVDIEVSSITEEMINNAVTIQFANVQPVDFVKTYKKDFQKALKKVLNVRMRDVEIINIQSSVESVDLGNRAKRSEAGNLDVLFAVRKSVDIYVKQTTLRRKVSQAAPVIEESLQISVVKVFSDICQKDFCEGGECAGYVEFDKDSLVPVLMDTGSFVAAKHRYTYECVCPNGNVGDNCLDNPESCDENPCPVYKICSANPTTGYQCDCSPGKTGRRCQKDLENKCDDSNCHRGDTPITFSGESFARWTLTEPIDSRLSLSLRLKTRKMTASLMYAKGRVDYSILELVNGQLQYRFDCGSGEGLVRVPNIVSDGDWHTIMVERHGNEAEIFLDGQYSAMTMAPGTNDVLNLDTSDVYFGAEVEVYANGYVDVRKGFTGCMEDIRIYNVRLPVSGSNAVALSQEFTKVEFSCKDSDVIYGNNVCSSFPCMNGGKCENTGPQSYICKCSDRYRGTRCEIDTDPCSDSPCLHNGKCSNVPGIPNEFSCECPGKRKGRRCEYGEKCLPNPCLHGGSCIEGPDKYMCLCRQGYDGTRCQTMVDFCDSDPCQNNGVCIQEGNSFYCNCSDGHTGKSCEELVMPVITSSSAGIVAEEIYAIIGAIAGILFLVMLFVSVRLWRQRKRRHRRNNITTGIANEPDVCLNLLKNDKYDLKPELKSKDSNKTQNVPPSPRPPPVPDRPASYTPSGHAESLNALNNFDSLRNYGSAADELENVPNIPYNHEFLQTFAPPRSVASVPPTLPPPPPSNPGSDCDSLQKEPWEFACQNILENYMSDKHSDKLSKNMPVGTVAPMSRLHGNDTTSVSSLPISESEDDLPGYHWDTSDWAPQKSLPNISEIPTTECPDSPGSSSPQSNESNTHVNMDQINLGHYTEGEYNSEYVEDSEYAENEYDPEEMPMLPNYEQILMEQNRLQEDYELPQHGINNIHPNQYLPNHSFSSEHNNSAEVEIWPAPPPYDDVDISDRSHTSEDIDNDSVLHYGFPSTHGGANRLSTFTDSEFNDDHRLSAAYTTDSEFNGDYNRCSIIDNLSMGGNQSVNASVSDISGLCEIEDSEVNLSEESDDENTPFQLQRQHTEV